MGNGRNRSGLPFAVSFAILPKRNRSNFVLKFCHLQCSNFRLKFCHLQFETPKARAPNEEGLACEMWIGTYFEISSTLIFLLMTLQKDCK